MRQQVYDRFRGRCVFPTCRVFLTIDAMHAHEVTFRSLGGDPLDVAGIVPTCGVCHNHLHVRVGGKLKRIEGTEAAGYQFYERATGKAPWADVTPPGGFVPPQ